VAIDTGASIGSVADLVRLRAAQDPEGVAYRFIADAGDESAITCAELDARARAVARRLCDAAARHDPVLLMFPPGIEFLAAFFGAMYAGVVAVPVAPPAGPVQWSRFQAIGDDARAKVGLTTRAQLAMVVRRNGGRPELDRVSWQTIDDLPSEPERAGKPREGEAVAPVAPVAYVQYTSGSTADPKGVIVTHASVLANLAYLHACCLHTPASVSVSWLPHVHDMGLVYGILSPMFGGYEGVLLSPFTFVRRPLAWLEAMSRYRATHTAAPNFAYDHCARRCASRDLGALDLSRLVFAANGSEPVRWDTMERFARVFAASGFHFTAFRPAYGLAEATLMVTVTGDEGPAVDTVARIDERSGPTVACGRPRFDTTVAIVDPDRAARVPDGQAGEIWVSGPGVAAGYWRRSDETRRTFGARLPDAPAGPFLRTGDLGWMRGGQLFVSGRLKELVILSGRNHHPVDLERTMEACHPAIRRHGCAAFSMDIDGEERLAVAAEVDPSYEPDVETAPPPSIPATPGLRSRVRLRPDTLTTAIRLAIALGHDVQPHRIALVAPGGLPRTSNGKIQRRACRALLLADRLPLWPSSIR
jgi:acyl-CoA synthetase (AMP-forming)/AMP-acid ligase II